MKQLIKNMRHTFRDMDQKLLLITIILIVFGLFNIVTASSSEAITSKAPLYYYFYQQLKMLSIALVAAIIIINTDTKNYSVLGLIGYIGVLGLLLYLWRFGNAHRGSTNWINIMGITFQPSEFAKPVVIVCLSVLFEKFYKKLKNKNISHTDMIAIILGVGCVFPLIIFLQKDLGTAMILLAIFGIMFIGSPVSAKEKGIWIRNLVILTAIVGLVIFNVKGYLLSAEQKDRFDFFNPCSNYEEGGYQTCNGFIAINDGGLFGLGPGKSKQKYSYIPEPHTDSVFAIIVEENGLFWSSLILFGLFMVLKRILLLATRASTIKGRYICLGTATYIFMHILINLGGLLGIMPLTGVPLPFLSYGGSFTISLIAMLAVVQRVHIETQRQKIKIA